MTKPIFQLSLVYYTTTFREIQSANPTVYLRFFRILTPSTPPTAEDNKMVINLSIIVIPTERPEETKLSRTINNATMAPVHSPANNPFSPNNREETKPPNKLPTEAAEMANGSTIV